MDDDYASSVAEAVRRTGVAGMTRVFVESSTDTAAVLKTPQTPKPPRRGLGGLAGRVADKGFELWMRYLLRSASEVRRADGFIDLDARRCAIDYGAYAELIEGSNEWSGRSGRSLATLPPEPASALSPLWLFDLLRGVTEAAELGSEPVRGRSCRRLRASVDLARVAREVPGKTPLPPGAFFEELGALPVETWLDEDGYVRRIRFEHRGPGGASQTYTLELHDFGTEDKLDWSRLPLLKDPRAATNA